MIYKQYGELGLNVSAVGFGGMRFDTSRPKEENAELLLHAESLGISYFDTAPDYCEDQSEDIFGIALRQMASRRDHIYVSTKGMPSYIHTAAQAREAVHKSLERLGIDKIDFYHVWCVRKMAHYESAMKPGGQYEGLLACQEEGLIDHIVISSHLQGVRIRGILEDGKFEGVLLGVNILNSLYRWEAVQAAYEAGLGVVAMNPLSGGLIPQTEREFAFLGQDGETPVEAHIDTACRVADRSAPFAQEDLDRIRAHISGNMEALCTGCGYCLKSCPVDIPVANYMQFYNDKPLFGKAEEEMMKKLRGEQVWGILADLPATAGDCTTCGACEEACTQHLNIIERLAEIAYWEKAVESQS